MYIVEVRKNVSLLLDFQILFNS